VSLLAFIVRRLLWLPLFLLGVMLATYALIRGAGGSPFRPPEGFTGVPYTLERVLRDFYHLDEPWLVEFGWWVKNVFTLEFGPSLVQRGLEVDAVIEHAFPITLQLVGLAVAWAAPVGVALGVWAATRRNSILDLAVTSAASALLVVPVFFVAFVLARYPVREWHWFPLGWDTWDGRLLPVFALGLAPLGYVARLVRGAFVEAMEEDYVRTARAKGLRERRVVWFHILPNALAPFLAAAIPMIALLVTGAIFVEEAFGIPGASSFFVQAALTRDYPLVMNLTVALAVLVLVANLLADVLLAVVDPRIREGRS
jgi:ABC-type dipeptide/oligopeptide/nickel transport system permease component